MHPDYKEGFHILLNVSVVWQHADGHAWVLSMMVLLTLYVANDSKFTFTFQLWRQHVDERGPNTRRSHWPNLWGATATAGFMVTGEWRGHLQISALDLPEWHCHSGDLVRVWRFLFGCRLQCSARRPVLQVLLIANMGWRCHTCAASAWTVNWDNCGLQLYHLLPPLPPPPTERERETAKTKKVNW